MKPLQRYSVFVKLYVLAENEADAVDSAQAATDQSDLLDQDGIVGFEVLDEDFATLDTDEDEE